MESKLKSGQFDKVFGVRPCHFDLQNCKLDFYELMALIDRDCVITISRHDNYSFRDAAWKYLYVFSEGLPSPLNVRNINLEEFQIVTAVGCVVTFKSDTSTPQGTFETDIGISVFNFKGVMMPSPEPHYSANELWS